MERRLYKVALSVNFNKAVNLEEEFQKIIETAEEFSDRSKCKRVLTTFCIEKDMISFLIEFNTNKGYEKFTLRAVTDFLKEICSIFNIEYNSRKKYFSIEEEGLSLLEEEYERLLSDAHLFITTRLNVVVEDKEELTSITEEAKSEDDKGEAGNVVNLENVEIYMRNKANIKIPKRKFPTVLNENARFGGNDKRQGIEYSTLIDSMKQLDNLIGRENIKNEIKKLTLFIIRNNERCVNMNIDNPGLYYNAVISGNKSTGKNTLAKILYHIYYHLGVIGKGKFIIVDSKEAYPGNNLDRFLGNTQSGVILIDNAHMMSINERRGVMDNFSTLDNWFSQYKNNFVFILAGEANGINELMKSEKVKKHLDFSFNIPDFTEKDTLQLVKHFAESEKYNVDVEAEDALTGYIVNLKKRNIFENAYTAKRIVEKAIIKNGAASNYLMKGDFCIDDINTIDIKKEKLKARNLILLKN